MKKFTTHNPIGLGCGESSSSSLHPRMARQGEGIARDSAATRRKERGSGGIRG